VMIAATMWAFEVPADAYQLGRTRVFFKAGEISRVEAILKTDMTGAAGLAINERMVMALERRQKALDAVTGVEALMAKAAPGVDMATQVLEDVDDALRQISRDFASASEVLGKGLALVASDAKDFQAASVALDKVKADPKCAALDSEESTGALGAAEAALEAAREIAARIGSELDLDATRRAYGDLKSSAKDLAVDTRAMVGDITAAMARIKVLHREATDGAKRCLLDYTLQRTSSAEAECEGLLVLVAELSEGGSAGAMAKAMEEKNDSLRAGSTTQCSAVEELLKTSAASCNEVQEQLKVVRAEMRKAESKAQAAAAAERQAAAAAARAASVAVGGQASVGSPGAALGFADDGTDDGGGSGGGGGGGGVVVTPEMAATIAALVDKVAMIEKHHGDQLRALVAKTKELHRVVKVQQEQLEKLGQVSAAGDGAVLSMDDLPVLPPPAPAALAPVASADDSSSAAPAAAPGTAPEAAAEAAVEAAVEDEPSGEGGMAEAMSKILSQAMADVENEEPAQRCGRERAHTRADL